MPRIHLFAALLLLISSAPLFAAESATDSSTSADSSTAGAAADSAALFKLLDSNADGQLSGGEVPEEKKSLFDRLVRLGDADGNGELSADEFAAGLGGKSAAEKSDEKAVLTSDESSPAEKPAAGTKKKKNAKKKPGKGKKPAKPEAPGKAGKAGAGQFFAKSDANGDGKLTLDEIPEQRRPMFEKQLARLDKDGDGALSKAEMNAAMPVKMASTTKTGKPDQAGKPQRDPEMLFKRLDANADGKVVVEEAPEARREMITRMLKRGDKDGDEALSLEEFTVIMARARQAQAKAANSEGKPATAKAAETPAKKKGNPNKKGKGKNAAKQAAQGGMPGGLFAALDSDHDGSLSISEIDAASSVLTKLDKNGDGALSPREVGGGKNKKKKKDNSAS